MIIAILFFAVMFYVGRLLRRAKHRRDLLNACADMTGDLRTVGFFEYWLERANYRVSRIINKEVK